jgi:uncharacterized protein (TIGR00369 family)
VLHEPVRGSVPDPSFYSLSGLDQVRAYAQRKMAMTPHAQLLGYRVTQVNAGTVVVSQRLSPWFEIYDGFVDLSATAEVSIFVAALSGAPAGSYVRPVNMSIRYLRPCTVGNEALLARGRILHAGSNFTTAESLIEDVLGRAVAHATGSVLVLPMDPPPPPLSRPLDTVDEPVYPTPAPAFRPLPHRSHEMLPPIGQFLGIEIIDASKGSATVRMPASEWFSRSFRDVAPGLVAAQAYVAATVAMRDLPSPDERWVTIEVTTSFLAPVMPDGRTLTTKAAIGARRDSVIVLDVETTDADGRAVLTGRGTLLLRERAPRPGLRPADRVLLTVLFTDLVASTERAGRLGDARWGELLAEHHAVVRRQLELFKGQEVKTTGDGFLMTFDSPTRAVGCARAIREGVARLGLEVRAGVHTGECEVASGDVAGVAVHVAARLQALAQPGEIVVSSTVKDLAAGSGIEFEDRGEYDLKGVPGTWKLFAVEG